MKKEVIAERSSLVFEGANFVEVNKINGDKSIVCDLIQEEIAEDGTVTEIRREVDFIFLEGEYPCELTEEDLETLNPIQDENNSQQDISTDLHY